MCAESAVPLPSTPDARPGAVVFHTDGLAVPIPGHPRAEALEVPAWSVRSGELWVVIGAPGSGKSDLLSVLAGLQPPLRGQVERAARPLVAPAHLTQPPAVGLVFEQGGRLFHQLTAAGNIALPLCYHHNQSLAEVEAEVEALLAFAGLSAMGGATPGRLKPAQQQRVALARALASRPAAVLVDNPLAGLPAQEAGWWTEALPRLGAGCPITDGRPLGVVVTGDDPRVWGRAGTHFVLLHQGQWAFLGDRAAAQSRQAEVLRCVALPD